MKEFAIVLKVEIPEENRGFMNLNDFESKDMILRHSGFNSIPLRILRDDVQIKNVFDIKLLEILEKNKVILEQYMENETIPSYEEVPGYSNNDNHFIFEIADWFEATVHNSCRIGYWAWVRKQIIETFGFFPINEITFFSNYYIDCYECGCDAAYERFYGSEESLLCPECGNPFEEFSGLDCSIRGLIWN